MLIDRWKILFFGLICATLILGCESVQQPVAKQGLLDLSSWKFAEQGKVPLKGEWLFYWRQLIQPGSFPASPASVISVPGLWNDRTSNGITLNNMGYATYRLVLRLPPGMNTIGVRAQDQNSAFRLFVNGSLVAENGRVGTSREITSGFFLPRYAIAPVLQENEIVVQISNFQSYKGGFGGTIEIGTVDQISNLQFSLRAIEFIIFGAILIIGLYHLILFAFRSREKATLYFCLFCFTTAFRVLVIGEFSFNTLFPSVAHAHVRMLEYLTLYLGLPLFVLFLYDIFRGIVPRKVLLSILSVSGCFMLSVIVLPLHIFTRGIFHFQIFVMVVAIYIGLIVPVLALRKSHRDALPFLIGWLPLFGAITHDVLRNNFFFSTPPLISAGVCLFIFAQSAMLARRFAKSREIIEDLSHELEQRNTALQNLNYMKDEFLSNVSHEMRTPLTSITMGLEFLNDPEAQPQLKKMAMENIQTGTEKINHLIDRMLLSSDLKAGNADYAMTMMDLLPALDTVRSEVREKYPQLEAEICGDNVRIYANPGLVFILLTEILSNAALHGGGKIRITVEPGEKYATLRMADSGPGVSADFIPKLGMKFQKADTSVTYEKSGTGLGLYLATRITELLNGKIAFQNLPQGGFEVRLSLPLQAS